MTHKIAIKLHPVAESCTICSSLFRQPVRKLLDTPSYKWLERIQLTFYIWGHWTDRWRHWSE